MENSSIQVAVTGDTAYVRICGNGSFKNSPALKQFLAHTGSKGCASIVFDMRKCNTMDSTFMGVLAGAASSLRKRDIGMRLVHLSRKNVELLSTLGLNHLMELLAEEDTPEDTVPELSSEQTFEAVPDAGADKKERTEIMLDAHETLVQLKPSNQARFEDVIEYLKDSLESGESPSGGPV